MAQDDFTPEALAAKLTSLFKNPEKLKTMARATANSAELHAAVKLADLIENKTSNRTNSSVEIGKVVA
jgi:UDP-N-acetylglucosamine:LPS N-acetylglucosamine transferase